MSSLAQDALGTPIVTAETYAVSAYLTSRDMVDRLAKNDNLRAILSRPEGDFVFRYPTFWLPDNNEFLYRRFQWMATSNVDDTTGISTIEVNAFNAEDAQTLARTMLGYAEALVDRMNERMYRDQLASAERFVADAQKDVDAIEAELKAFRNVSGSVDPNLVAQSKLQVIAGLSTQLAQVDATIAQQVVLARTSPTLEALRAQAQSYRDEIRKAKLGNCRSVRVGSDQVADLRSIDLAAQSSRTGALRRGDPKGSGATSGRTAAPLYSTHFTAQPGARLGALSTSELGSAGASGALLGGLPGVAQASRLRRGAPAVSTVEATALLARPQDRTAAAAPAEMRPQPRLRSVRIERLVKEYHTPIGLRRVLDGISFEVREGEKIAVLGRNGSGKSTLGQTDRRSGISHLGDHPARLAPLLAARLFRRRFRVYDRRRLRALHRPPLQSRREGHSRFRRRFRRARPAAAYSHRCLFVGDAGPPHVCADAGD